MLCLNLTVLIDLKKSRDLEYPIRVLSLAQENYNMVKFLFDIMHRVEQIRKIILNQRLLCLQKHFFS